MAFRDYITDEIVHDCADGILSRRAALRRLAILGLSLPVATTLLTACGDDEDSSAASTTAPPGRIGTGASAAEVITFAGSSGTLSAAFAAAAEPTASVLVIHENRGLTPHFHDLVGRFAAQGYAALSVDLVSADGGTEALGEDAVPGALGNAPTERLVGDLRAGIDELERRAPDRKVGAVGFCFGGGMVWQLLAAGEARLAAAAPFYGPFPDGADLSNADAAVLAVYGALDSRVNASRDAAAAALEAAGLTHELKTYDGADHAFFNDTGQRYNADVAAAAWTALLAWFQEHLS